MSFVKFLQGIGDQLGILESVESPDGIRSIRIQTRTISLHDLACEIKGREVRALADSPSELAVPFEKIFETAGISSRPEEWTIDRLQQLLCSETNKNKPREELQRSVLEMLKTENVPVETLVKDAMARDQALDSYEAIMGEKMQARIDMCRKRVLEIESRIQNLQKESADLEKALKMDEEKWKEWRRRKREKERDLALTVGYVVDHPVITLGDEDEA